MKAVLAVVMVCLSAASAVAQRTPLMATVTSVAPIYIEPKELPIPLRTAAVGTRLEVLEVTGEWVNVRFGDPLLGPRVGYTRAKLLRIEYPELQPVDLSIKPETPEQAPRPPAPAPRAPASPSFSESPVERSGFMIGFSAGGGVTFCYEDCGWNGTGLLDFHIGGMVNDRTSLQYEGTGVAFYVDDEQLVWQLNSFAAQFWTGRRNWLKVGGGFALLTCEDCVDYEVGPGLLVASGFEMVQRQKFVLDLQSRFTYSRFDDGFDDSLNLSKLLVSIGFNWY